MKEYMIIMRGATCQKINDIINSRNTSDAKIKEIILSHIREKLIKIYSHENLSVIKMDELKIKMKAVVESTNNSQKREVWVNSEEIKFTVFMPSNLYNEKNNITADFSVMQIENN